MVFGFKKKMIDVGEMQKQGRVLPPNMNRNFDTDSEGFVNINGAKMERVSGTAASQRFDSSDMIHSEISSNSQKNILNRLDDRIKDLDRILYKLEQRVELLERKAGISFGGNSSGESALGSLGW